MMAFTWCLETQKELIGPFANHACTENDFHNRFLFFKEGGDCETFIVLWEFSYYIHNCRYKVPIIRYDLVVRNGNTNYITNEMRFHCLFCIDSGIKQICIISILT